MGIPVFENIDWVFSTNKKNFITKLYNENKDNPHYLLYIDNLFKFLRENECKYIQEKFKFINDIDNFESRLSELEVAKLLLEYGKKVELIPDDYNEIIPPPDIHVIDKNFDAYIEVSKLTDDSTNELITKELGQIINEYEIPHAIDVDLNYDISAQAFRSERELKRIKVLEGIKEFSESYKHDSTQKIINTSIGIFKIRNAKISQGYVGTFLWGGIDDTKKYIDAIRRKVLYKAENRVKWKGEHLNKFFIIAIDFEDGLVDLNTLESALICSKTIIYIDSSLIDKAIKKGWDIYLKKMGIEQQQIIVEPQNWGIFFTKEIVKNVSGIIGICKGRPPIFIPNPFAYDVINDPKLEFFLND
jgi:hypothetical protein